MFGKFTSNETNRVQIINRHSYNICKQLWHEKNFYIKAGLRTKNNKVSAITHETSYFDVRNYQDFYRAAQDVDYIIHLAASFDHSSINKKKRFT